MDAGRDLASLIECARLSWHGDSLCEVLASGLVAGRRRMLPSKGRLNMVRLTTLALVLLAVIAVPAQAQTSGESLVGTDDRGGAFAYQYVFYDWQSCNLLTRYFWVNGAVNRGELAFGPTIKKGDTTVKGMFGGTTASEVMTATLIFGKIAKRLVAYTGDGKWSGRGLEFYQRLNVAIDPRGIWQFRLESLNFDRDEAFLRIGFEYQLQFHPQRQIFFAPFWDPVAGAPGAQVGFRFF